jgi:hypothetical protein
MRTPSPATRRDSREFLFRSGLPFKFRSRQARLPDDGTQRTNPQFLVVRYGNRCGSSSRRPLHDDVTAALAYVDEAVPSKMAHASRPDKTRSLPNGYLDLRDKDFAA